MNNEQINMLLKEIEEILQLLNTEEKLNSISDGVMAIKNLVRVICENKSSDYFKVAPDTDSENDKLVAKLREIQEKLNKVLERVLEMEAIDLESKLAKSKIIITIPDIPMFFPLTSAERKEKIERLKRSRELFYSTKE